MISYCWEEKKISKPIFEYLNSKGYRVWFDENCMHGDSLQAMANAIQSSECIVVCISENYERSNACRHEAEYAYVLKRRIVPIVAQPKYKARNWLGFLIGTLIYIDFTKHDFEKAIGMLEEEVKYNDKTHEVEKIDARQNQVEKKEVSKKSPTTEYENKCVNEWTHDDVVMWCQANNLLVFSQLLEHYDGTHLLRLHGMSKSKGDDALFCLLKQDCEQMKNHRPVSLTLVEFVRFQTELEKKIEKDTERNKETRPIQQETAKICSLF